MYLSSVPADELLELTSEVTKGPRGIAPFRRQRTLELMLMLMLRLRLRFQPMEISRQVRRPAAVDRQRRAHEAAPDVGGHGPPADFAQRLVVVAADPDADHEVAGETDEQGVAVLLRRPGLAEGRDSQRRPAPGPVVRGRVEKVEHRRPVTLPVQRPDRA